MKQVQNQSTCMLRLLFYSSLTSDSDMSLQKQCANALHMEERATTNNDDGSYRLLPRPPFKGPFGANPKRLK